MILAFVCVRFPSMAMVWGLVALVASIFMIYRCKNAHDEAGLCAAYYAALEMVLRVSQISIGYEIAKYAVMLFLIIGMSVENGGGYKKNSAWIIAIILLLPSMLIADKLDAEHFEHVRFSVSGIMVLLLSAYYYQGRSIGRLTYIKQLSYILLPILSLAVIVTLKTPDYADVTFTAESNAEMSGGVAPIHVSNILSIGALILIIFILLKQNVFKWTSLSYVILFLFAFRIIFTFARSGLFAMAIALVTFFVLFIKNEKRRGDKKKYISVILLGLVFFVAWENIDSITGGMSTNRFTGKDTLGEQKEDVTTGRTALLEQDMTFFIENPVLGVGAGNIADLRLAHYGLPHTSHTEYSRLLAEHGLLGLIVIIIIFSQFFNQVKRTRGWSKMFLATFGTFALFSMIPAATRVALPLFLFGLGFLQIREEDYS